jgi:hypothetical protein
MRPEPLQLNEIQPLPRTVGQPAGAMGLSWMNLWPRNRCILECIEDAQRKESPPAKGRQ